MTLDVDVDVDVQVQNDRVTVVIDKTDAEVGMWAARKRADMFETTFKRQLLFTLESLPRPQFTGSQTMIRPAF